MTNANFDFMSRSRIFAMTSMGFVILSMGYAAFTWNKHLGIEFAGGQLVTVCFEQPLAADELRTMVEESGIENPIIQTAGQGDREFIIRIHEKVQSPEEGTELTSYLLRELRNKMPDNAPLTERFTVEKVTGIVGKLLREQAWGAILFSLIGMLIYITIRFELIYALGAILALVHDVAFALGALVVWNLFFPGHPRELSLPVVAALLTVFGYSVNDTIVVFDRIRENRRLGKESLRSIINHSINQSLSRTIVTSLTTLLAVVSLLIFGGRTLNDFAYVLFVGVAVGTYSSIFIASWLVYEIGLSGQAEKQ